MLPIENDFVPTNEDLYGRMIDLTDTLEALLGEHRRIGDPMPDFLRAGIDLQIVRDTLAELGFVATEELVELGRYAPQLVALPAVEEPANAFEDRLLPAVRGHVGAAPIRWPSPC